MIENVRIAALCLSGYSHGIIEKNIMEANENGKPFRYAVVREALAIECRSFGARADVINTLRRELKRQESLMEKAA